MKADTKLRILDAIAFPNSELITEWLIFYPSEPVLGSRTSITGVEICQEFTQKLAFLCNSPNSG